MNEDKAIDLCIKHHDPAGFEFLFKQYRREAYMHALGLLRNPEDAADACQDCFRKAFQKIPALGKLDKFYPWFYSILRNHCLNVIKRRKTAANYAQNLCNENAYEKAAPDFLAEKDDEQLRIWKLMAQLSVEHREILTLKYFNELNYQQISETLKIPRGTVMSRIFNAKKALKSIYEKSEQNGGVL